MRKNRLISKLIAIVLLVGLSQKIGFGIFYHNWQHAKACSKTYPHSSPSVNGANCTCIDDFAMPFTEPGVELITNPVTYSAVFLSPSIGFRSHVCQCFQALRAPPARV